MSALKRVSHDGLWPHRHRTSHSSGTHAHAHAHAHTSAHVYTHAFTYTCARRHQRPTQRQQLGVREQIAPVCSRELAREETPTDGNRAKQPAQGGRGSPLAPAHLCRVLYSCTISKWLVRVAGRPASSSGSDRRPPAWPRVAGHGAAAAGSPPTHVARDAIDAPRPALATATAG